MNKGQFNINRNPFIFNKSGSSSGGGGGGITEIPINRTAFVDAVNGDDGTAIVGRLDLPFATINSAQLAVGTQSLIYVQPGTYNPTNLGKDGVDFYFAPGVQLTSTGSPIINTSGFMNTNFYGSAEIDSSAFNPYLIFWGHTTSNCYFECKSINQLDGAEAVYFNVSGTVGKVTMNVEDFIINSTGTDNTLRFFGAGNYYINCPNIDNQTGGVGPDNNQTIYLQAFSGQLFINCPNINKSVAGQGCVIRSRSGCSGDIYINGNIYGNSYTSANIYGGMLLEGFNRFELRGNVSTTNRPCLFLNDSPFVGEFRHFPGYVMESTNYETVNVHDNRHDAYFDGQYIANNVLRPVINNSQVPVGNQPYSIYINGLVRNNNSNPGGANCVGIRDTGPQDWIFDVNAKLIGFASDSLCITEVTAGQKDVILNGQIPTNVPVSADINNVVAGTGLIVDSNII